MQHVDCGIVITSRRQWLGFYRAREAGVPLARARTGEGHRFERAFQQAPLVDPWVALAAMSMTTTRIRLGTALTPLARRCPWKLARETVTLNQLCDGRLTLTVGLGHPPEADFAQFGDNPAPRVRAAKLDEGLEVLVGLWSGKSFCYTGTHYQIAPSVFLPRPVQTPRIPIWVGGFWPHTALFGARRAGMARFRLWGEAARG